MTLRRLLTALGGLLVGLVAVGSLASTAFHATTTSSRLVSARATREADYSDAYFACLSKEGRGLLHRGDTVYVAQDNLARWVVITKAVGGWAHLVEHRAHASVAVLLVDEPRHGQGPNCDGQALVTIRTLASGRVVMSRAEPGLPR
jgi:hypothetical protein